MTTDEQDLISTVHIIATVNYPKSRCETWKFTRHKIKNVFKNIFKIHIFISKSKNSFSTLK